MKVLAIGSLAMIMAIAGNSGINSAVSATSTHHHAAQFEQSELLSRGSYRSQSRRYRGETGRREVLS